MSLGTLLKSNLQGLNGNSPFGIFHNGLANTINYWFLEILQKQIVNINGIVTTPTGASYPLVIKLYPSVQSINLSSDILKSISNPGEQFIANLFSYIGTSIVSQLSLWTSISPTWVNAAISPVAGTVSVVFNTSHFITYGMNCKTELATLNGSDKNIFYKFWDIIEKYLKDAISKITSSPVIFTGICTTGGVFNGTTVIKFIV